jgi:hypothetical protein
MSKSPSGTTILFRDTGTEDTHLSGFVPGITVNHALSFPLLFVRGKLLGIELINCIPKHLQFIVHPGRYVVAHKYCPFVMSGNPNEESKTTQVTL